MPSTVPVELHRRVYSPGQLQVVEGGAHRDFCDVPECVDRTIAAATPFCLLLLLAQRMGPAPEFALDRLGDRLMWWSCGGR